MKKTISVILSFILILSSFSVAVFATTDDDKMMSFAVASDLHYNIPREELEGNIDDDIYWYANRRAAMEDESGFIIDEFLRQCAENDDCEFVLVSGDIVDNGRSIPQEHYDVAAKFAAFEEKTGKQIYVTGGNHDFADDCETTADDFKRIYADFGFDQALTIDDDTLSYTANLGKKYRLIALDSCDPTRSTADGMSLEKLEWVHEQANKAKEDGRYPILMMHHNLLDHMPLQRIFSQNFIVRFHLTTAELFANWGIKMVFTGHEHCSDVATYTSSLGNVIYDFATTSLTMYPLQYRMIYLTDDEIKYEAKTVDSIDTDALTETVSGFSDEQISLMNEGLNDYAKGFLKAGVRYRLSLSLSMEKMGIAEDAFYYDLVNTAVGGLLKILEEPLYGEGGIQQLAAEYNLEIPDSNYENGWDVATELVSAHYAGEEAFDFNTTEVTIFLRLIALVLRDDLATVADDVFLSAANALLENFGTDSVVTDLTKLGTKVFGAVNPIEYFLLALVSPIIYEFAVDTDGINDSNGTLPGYGTVDTTSNISNVFGKIETFFSDVLTYVNLFITFILKIVF